MKKIIFAFIFASALLVPVATLAQDPQNCQFDAQAGSICNPIASDNLMDLIIYFTRYLLGIIAVIAVTMIVIAGFRMVISAGNQESVKAAQGMITWSLVGLVIALLAYSIVAIIQSVIKG